MGLVASGVEGERGSVAAWLSRRALLTPWSESKALQLRRARACHSNQACGEPCEAGSGTARLVRPWHLPARHSAQRAGAENNQNMAHEAPLSWGSAQLFDATPSPSDFRFHEHSWCLRHEHSDPRHHAQPMGRCVIDLVCRVQGCLGSPQRNFWAPLAAAILYLARAVAFGSLDLCVCSPPLCCFRGKFPGS